MPLEIHSPSDNEINKADITIPDSGELAYDIVKSLQRRNDEDRRICDDNIRERNKIIKALQSSCDHNYIRKECIQECRKCAHITYYTYY